MGSPSSQVLVQVRSGKSFSSTMDLKELLERSVDAHDFGINCRRTVEQWCFRIFHQIREGKGILYCMICQTVFTLNFWSLI